MAPLTISILIFLLLLGAASANTTVLSCSSTYAVAPTSTYHANLGSLLTSLPKSAAPFRFANISLGSSPDRVFGLALCRGDSNYSICLSCLTAAASDAHALCPHSLSGAIFYDNCLLRFSDTRFFSTLTPIPPEPYIYSYDQVNEPDYFHDQAGRLLANLRDRAAFGNGTGLYASGWLDYGGGNTLYGLVQCTRDLSGELCAQCLEEPIRRITCCSASVELTYHGGSCYLRYSFSLFFNQSVAAPPPLSSSGATGNATTEAATATVELPQHGRSISAALVAGIVLGAIFLVLVALIAIRARRRSKRRIILGRGISENNERNGLMYGRMSSRKITFLPSQRNSESSSYDLRKLDLQMIKVATDNFSDAKRLGKGQYGNAYKGDLPGQELVVKRITAIPRVEVEVLKRQFRSFMKLEHPNIVRLLTGHVGEENLLLFEYLPNDSLDGVLFDNKKKVLLDWGRRFKIIQGTAQGLLYLQGDSGMNLIHQNLKATNILLDKHMNPKISGFCLPKFFTPSGSPQDSRKSFKTSGYMAPESLSNGIFTSKTDVYSYGVLVLEIITGQRNKAVLASENHVTLLNYVWQYWKDERATQVLDWSLGELCKKHEVLRCIHVGLLCVQEDPEKRPSMSAIVHMLSSFSYTPPSPLQPAVVKVSGTSIPVPAGEENGNSGHWDWRMNQAGGRVTPR